MEYFCCDCCNDMRPLDALLDLDCHCCICTNCCDERLRPCMKPVQPAPTTAAAEYAVGDAVRYAPHSLQEDLLPLLQKCEPVTMCTARMHTLCCRQPPGNCPGFLLCLAGTGSGTASCAWLRWCKLTGPSSRGATALSCKATQTFASLRATACCRSS